MAAWRPLPVLAALALGTRQVLTRGRQCHALLQGQGDPRLAGSFRRLPMPPRGSARPHAGGGLVPGGADQEAGVSGP